MKPLQAIILALFVCLTGTLTAGGIEVQKTVLDTEGQPVTGILVHAKPQGGNDAAALMARTDAQGGFSFTLQDGPWFIEVDAAELLERGYFCVPGWDPFGPDRPLVAVPLRPTLSYSFSGGLVTVVATFDWLPGLEPSQVQAFRVERSEDLVNWEGIGTIQLADPPIRLDDPYRKVERCFYRVVGLGLVVREPVNP